MATYYPTFSNQMDTLSTNNPGDEKPISYLGSTTYPNQASSMGEFSKILSGTSLSMHNCIQIPTMVGRNETAFMPPSTDALQSVDGRLIHNSVAVSHHAIPGSVLDGERNSQSQGLSLSLTSEIPSDDLQCGYLGNYNDAFGTNALSDMYQFQPGLTSTILNSKYLKVAQELLKEVINVQQALKQPDSDKNASSQPTSSSNGMSSEPSEPVNNSSELQNKKTKLLSMLHEVDRRYKQYYHQMKLVASSFDVVAGSGAAKQYTALSLQTISSHFRCLRDAISSQIQLIQRSLGEQDNSLNNQGAAIRRLRYVDHQLRQQRALQQLGVMRNAWRPQRGLPESSVSILRAWLFEHFLHPYPKDSEKIMLAKQTGLTRNQVANWFINARVRLWKPMIEEMYKEEFGEMDSSFKSSLEENYAASEDRGEEFQECMRSKVARVDNVQARYPKPDHNTDTELNMPANQHGHGTLTAGDAMYALALGLRNHENNIFSMHGETDTRGNNKVASSEEPETVNFHFTEPEHQQNRFGNPHILHDFVV